MFNFEDVYVAAHWVVVVTVGWLLLLAVSAVVVAKLKKEDLRFSTRELAYGGICIAIAFTLSFVAAWEMPQGGSITIFSVVPIIVYCYYFGYAKGALVSSVFMLLQFLQGPYIMHPFSALLDYIVPYTALSMVGLFCYNPQKNGSSGIKAHYKIFIGSAVYILIRYFSHFLSGVLFYADYAWEGWAVVPYSIIYNLIYCLPDFAVAMVGVVALMFSKTFTSFMSSQVAYIRSNKQQAV